MAEVTPNLGLKKPLESEFVSIQTLNENMDKVDQSLGALSELPTTNKNAAGAISEIYDQLAEKPHEQLTLTPGVQIVQGGDVPAILHPTMQGRTLVNLLGRDGNCESASTIIAKYQTVVSLETNKRAIGLNSINIRSSVMETETFTVVSTPAKYSLTTGKHYVAACYFHGNNSSVAHGVSFQKRFAVRPGDEVWTDIGINEEYVGLPDEILTSNGFNSYGFVFTALATAKYSMGFGIQGVGQNYWVDGLRLIEISAAEKTYINSLTVSAAQAYIAAKYPYVDDMKHVNAVYIENKGKNLLPPFSEWTQYAGSSAITGSYSFTLNSGSVIQFDVPCVLNQPYTFSTENPGGGRIALATFDENKAFIAQTGYVTTGSVSKSTEASARYLRVIIDTTGLSARNFSNPMLNIGPDPLPFEPQKPSYLYLPDCNLRSNADGSVADRLYTDGQGKPRVTRRFREIPVDGSLPWYTVVTDFAGYKVVIVTTAKDGITEKAAMVKYDGKVMTLKPNSSSINGGDQFYTAVESTYSLGVAVYDTDTGWGESYTPTADEIKAYFYGWIMYNGDVGVTTPYNGTGTKWWAYRNDNFVGTISAGTVSGGTNVTPTTQAPVTKGWQPYRLMYQLAQSVDEPVNYEGALMLHEGDNQIEVGTGIVVREAVAPSGVALDKYHINTNVNGIPNLLKNRPDLITKVFKNSVVDDWSKGRRSSDHVELSVYGYGYASIQKGRFDPTATYSVTYLALDTYALGIAPQTISAEYAPNIRESVESLVRELVEARTETSVLANTKAQKQQPQWIVPTLRNDWVNSGGAYELAGYRKDDQGNVLLRGAIKSGTVGTVAFILPVGYRPKLQLPFATLGSDGTNRGFGNIDIKANGEVTINIPTSNALVSLNGIIFQTD